MSQTASLSHSAAPAGRVSYRALLAAVVGTAAIAGFAVTSGDVARSAQAAAGQELATLLRGMALLKVAMIVAALALIDWRLRQPVAPRTAAAYLVGAAMMATGPGLIWDLAHVVAGAVVLHAGLALLIVLACTDGGVRNRWAPR